MKKYVGPSPYVCGVITKPTYPSQEVPSGELDENPLDDEDDMVVAQEVDVVYFDKVGILNCWFQFLNSTKTIVHRKPATRTSLKQASWTYKKKKR